eukprot:m.16856 g.16856  ORF g.16856 m.16856 type:complete len:162 (-) comp6991_c0_seq2:86-571(-)
MFLFCGTVTSLACRRGRSQVDFLLSRFCGWCAARTDAWQNAPVVALEECHTPGSYPSYCGRSFLLDRGTPASLVFGGGSKQCFHACVHVAGEGQHRLHAHLFLDLIFSPWLQKRRFWVSFSQVFFPLLFFALLALLRLSIPREDGGQREPAWIVKCVHTFT